MCKTEERLRKLIENKEKENNSDIDFLKSLLSNLEKWGTLTERQSGALDRIEYLSSPAGIQEVEDWKEEYHSGHKEKAKVVAGYYLKSGHYFRDMATRIQTEEDYTPSKKAYKAMVENKYSKKVLKEYNREPQYQKGEIVQIRESANLPWLLKCYCGKLCVIIDNRLDSITTYATGGKEYRLLPFGEKSNFITCQERFLKSFRKKAK
jgi:hypothetical protein